MTARVSVHLLEGMRVWMSVITYKTPFMVHDKPIKITIKITCKMALAVQNGMIYVR
jgi:hypothetical protein